MNPAQSEGFLRLRANPSGFQTIPAGDIQSIEFTPSGGMEDFYPPVSAKDQDTIRLIQHINFANPVTTDAKPGGIIIGSLKVVYASKENPPQVRTFKLIGTTLLQDSIHPDTYYHASEALRECLEKPSR